MQVSYREFVAPYLCEVIPEARLVVLQYPSQKTPEMFPCNH